MSGAQLRVQVLGPVRAWQGGNELDLGPGQQRAVLAVLALTAGTVVSRDELAAAVWDSLPQAAGSMLYKYVRGCAGC